MCSAAGCRPAQQESCVLISHARCRCCHHSSWALAFNTQGYSSLLDGLLEVHLEVTLVTCKENATVPYPKCEEQLLSAIFERLSKYEDVQQQWGAAGAREGLL